jgi:hypothetical protein
LSQYDSSPPLTAYTIVVIGIDSSFVEQVEELTCSRHNIAEKIAALALNNNHSLTHSINQKWILKEENNFNSRKFHLAKI